MRYFFFTWAPDFSLRPSTGVVGCFAVADNPAASLSGKSDAAVLDAAVSVGGSTGTSAGRSDETVTGAAGTPAHKYIIWANVRFGADLDASMAQI